MRFCGEKWSHAEALPKSADKCTSLLLNRLALIVYEKGSPAIALASEIVPANRDEDSDATMSSTMMFKTSPYISETMIVTLADFASAGGIPRRQTLLAFKCDQLGPSDITDVISESPTMRPSSVRLLRNSVEENCSPGTILIA